MILGYFRRRKETKNDSKKEAWQRDFLLEKNEKLYLFEEYLEMVIQFGFCTIFVAAFPLAPLMALLNNIVEIRLDAFKFIRLKRRVPVQMTKDIGAWAKILDSLASVSLWLRE